MQISINKKKIKINKRALSNIVTTLLIIILSLAIVATLWLMINSFANKPNLSPKVSCIDLQSKNELKIEKSCFNKDTNELEITIKRTFSGNEIDNVQFSLDSEVWQCTDSCGNCIIPSSGEAKTYFFDSNNANPENSNIKIYISSCLLDEKPVESC